MSHELNPGGGKSTTVNKPTPPPLQRDIKLGEATFCTPYQEKCLIHRRQLLGKRMLFVDISWLVRVRRVLNALTLMTLSWLHHKQLILK